MPILLRHNDEIELNRVEYQGSVTREELLALAAFQTKAPTWLGFDCLNVIHSCVDFDSVPLSELDDIFAQYQALYATLTFHIARRSAWICQTDAARGHLSYWLFDRDTKAMSSVVREFATFEEAGDWLVLKPCEAHAAERGIGFAVIARFEVPALKRAV